jgi:signal transduction histidine kinase
MLDLVHPDERATVERVIQMALRTGQAFSMEHRIVRPDGEMRELRSVGDFVKDAAGRPVRMVISVLEITEQKRSQDALRASAEQLQALSRRLVEVQESERKRLSRELHDRVGQNLTALGIDLDILKTQLSGDARGQLHSRLEDSISLVEATADAIVNVMSELRPPMLDDHGLLPALHWYARAFSRRTGIDVVVSGNEPNGRPGQEIEVTLFRIAQEALNNVAKHARAGRVEIEFDHSGSEYVMFVADDGIGFDPAGGLDAMARPGRGMLTMRERSQAAGGEFEVRTAPGRGTQIRVRVPC